MKIKTEIERLIKIYGKEVSDKLWKDGFVTRKEAYKILDDEFGKEIHIGESDIETCQRIINLLSL